MNKKLIILLVLGTLSNAAFAEKEPLGCCEHTPCLASACTIVHLPRSDPDREEPDQVVWITPRQRFHREPGRNISWRKMAVFTITQPGT